MTAAEFPTFYEALHGFPPFPWQVRLVEKLLGEGAWPTVIDIPTACGKTSVIDAAVYSLAAQSDRPLSKRSVPLRTFFVIDRRVVVDAAAEHAVGIADALRQSLVHNTPPTIVTRVAEKLMRFGGDAPLSVAVLRGGIYRDDSWIAQPCQPLICLTTVDQFGSRLLFRGYHLSESQRPIHAALVGTDSLVIVDEAHLSEPFLNTLEQVRKYQTWAKVPAAKPLQFVQMSATVRDARAPLSLSTEDYANPVLGKRLAAKKFAELVESADFEQDAVALARRLASESQTKVVGVIVNRVGSARTIFEMLSTKDAEAVLLTGRIRPYDRDRLLLRFLPRMRAGRDRNEDRPLFAVATQTVEVGADLDFDALIAEAAPMDALVQRFGRLDRLGELGTTRAVVVLRKIARSGEDPIYGEPLRTAWTWLRQRAHRKKKTMEINFGVDAMRRLLAEHGDRSLYSPTSVGPLLFPAHVETWVQTSPTPVPDPDVAPFLHGPEALKAADVQVIWRADLELGREDEWLKIVVLTPPTVREALPVSIGAMRGWLRTRAAVEMPDTEGRQPDETEAALQRIGRTVLVWRGPDHSRIEDNPIRIAPGDTVLVPAVYGGVDEFGWVPLLAAPASDVADHCANELADFGRQKYRLRLHADLLFPTPDSRRDQFRNLLELLRQARDEDEPCGDLFEAALSYIHEHRPELQTVTRALVSGFVERFYPSGGRCVLAARRVSSPPRLDGSVRGGGADVPGEDDTSSLKGRAVTLRDHSAGVAGFAERFALSCGVPDQLVQDLMLAGSLHDGGKCDPRFQVLLHGGNAASAAAEPEAIAKSGLFPFAVAEYREARRRSGYPQGARHEFTSVALLRHADCVSRAHDRELVLHLIGSHHGYGRPFPPVCQDQDPIPVIWRFDGGSLEARSDHGVEHLEFDWCGQFWRLVERYGYWGLSFLESVLRLADWAQSRKEQEG